MEILDGNNLLPPFLRWTGSKRWFTKDHIERFLPPSFKNYHEPFLGGGAVFFYLRGKDISGKHTYFLSDSNPDLINCYCQIRDNVENVIRHLKTFTNSEKEYYKIRHTTSTSDAKRAAIFIYLNRTSFNGIYRVNSLGQYNVPYGHRPQVDTVTSKLLRDISKILNQTIISNCSFEHSIKNIKNGDLVFIDPPYTVAHENNGFIEYNQKLFSWDDQLKLKRFIQQIIEKDAYFILSNASHNSILELYTEIGDIKKLERLSKVGGRNKTRGIYNELIVHNTKY